MTTDVPDTVGSLARDRSFYAPAGAAGAAENAPPVAGPSTSSQPDLGDDNVLEDIEMQAAASKETGTTTRKRRRTSADVCKEDEWMAKLQENIEANNQLLQQVMQERAQPVTQKSAFLNYFSKYMQELSGRTWSPAVSAAQPAPSALGAPPQPIVLSPGKKHTSYYSFSALGSPQFSSRHFTSPRALYKPGRTTVATSQDEPQKPLPTRLLEHSLLLFLCIILYVLYVFNFFNKLKKKKTDCISFIFYLDI